MYAIIETGGKQYKVEKDLIVNVEKIQANVGDTVELKVLLLADDNGSVKTGNDLANASVKAEVLGDGKGEKVIVFHYKAKKQIRKKQGHRQPYTSLKITSIVG